MPEIKQYDGTLYELIYAMERLMRKAQPVRLDSIPDCLRPALERWVIDYSQNVAQSKDEQPLFNIGQIRNFWKYVTERGIDFFVHFKK